jgi:TRAP-type C4-dicarboxylate transport system permease small subunit
MNTEFTTEPAKPDSLSTRDRKMVERLRNEEQKRYVYLFFNALIAALLLFLFWDAPFVMHRLGRLPYSEAIKIPFYETRFIAPWLVGVFILIRGIYDCFFNRRRKLVLKLAGELEQSRNG